MYHRLLVSHCFLFSAHLLDQHSLAIPFFSIFVLLARVQLHRTFLTVCPFIQKPERASDFFFCEDQLCLIHHVSYPLLVYSTCEQYRVRNGI